MVKREAGLQNEHKRKRVTINQVARAAGVSSAAVSFAFNEPTQVGAETAERIRTIARELGYAPSPIARAMISRSTGAIGLLVPLSIADSFNSPFIPAFLHGVGSVCDAHSIDLLIISPYEGSLEQASRRALVDGLIILGLSESHGEIEPLRRRQVPFVIVDGDAQSVSEVNSDDEAGAYASAQYLLSHGHKDVLVLTFERPFAVPGENMFYGVGARRIRGYQRAFDDYGVELRTDGLYQSVTSVEGGAHAFRLAWEHGRRPTALLSMSDAKALGAIREAKKVGVRVPEDMEVIGFDDIPIAVFSQPALSTVRQPIALKGKRAAELLVASLEGNIPSEKVLYDTELILRETTRHSS